MFDFKNAEPDELKAKYKEIAEKMGDDEFFTKKELKYLPEALMDKEQVLAFSSGVMGGNTWLIALTDKRILFLDKGMIYGLKQTAISLERINSVSGSTGIFFGNIEIADGGQVYKITNVWKKTVKLFTNMTDEQIQIVRSSNNSSQTIPVATTVVSSSDPIQQLEKLGELLAKGILTDDEFAIQKQKILGN